MNDHITTDLRFSMVPAWVLDSGISDKAIRLYAVLAGYADSETGQAYPGRTLLSKRLACSTKTVDRAVVELLKVGAVKKQQRVKDGHYQSSLYTVVRVDPASGMSRPSVTDVATPRHARPDPVSPVSQRTITTELEPLKPEPLNDIVQDFNEFWDIYPRKQGKGKAKEAFIKAIQNHADVYEILGGAKRYASDPNLPDPKFVPMPATWLNQGRWDDGPLPLNRELTNSERNIQNLRASMALLEEPMKEVENGKVTGQGVIDFGVNLRSTEDI